MKLLIKFLAALILSVSAASAVTVDGDPSDWNAASPTFLTGDWKLNDTWLPGSGIQFTVEDNNNPNHGTAYNGVHITSKGSGYVFYDEPKVQHKSGNWFSEPYGSPAEPYDLEAIYFQQDTENVYVLIVTSEKPDATGDGAPGDLRIDINTMTSGDGYKYEKGVKLGSKTGLTQFDIYDVSDWADTPDYIPSSLPAVIAAGTKIDRANGFYNGCSGCNLGTGMDYGEPIYIVELAVPKSALGGPGTYNFDDFSVVDKCTNDGISIPIPEFAVIALPIAGIIGLVFVLRTRRKEH